MYQWRKTFCPDIKKCHNKAVTATGADGKTTAAQPKKPKTGKKPGCLSWKAKHEQAAEAELPAYEY